MEASESGETARKGRAWRAVVPSGMALAVLVGAVLLAGSHSKWPIVPPPCLLKSMTGIPCPGCGGTRAFASLAQGDAVKAFAFNPLAVTGVAVVILWFVCGLIALALPGDIFAGVRLKARGFGKGWLLLGLLIAAHWVYLVITLD